MHLILKVRSGSRAYGLHGPDSDEDSRGICIPFKKHLLGLEPLDQYESAGGDHVIYGLPKFTRLALEGNPNIIETLYTEDILHLHPLGEKLREHRDIFLSTKVADRFGSYALHQLQKIQRHHKWLTNPPEKEPRPEDYAAVRDRLGQYTFPDKQQHKKYAEAHKHWTHYQEWRAGRNRKRAELESEYGYDTKHAMHLCRLLTMGIEILKTGQVRVKREHDAEWLKSIKRGAYSYQELTGWATQQQKALSAAKRESQLAGEPDRDKAEQLQIEIIEEFHWGKFATEVQPPRIF